LRLSACGLRGGKRRITIILTAVETALVICHLQSSVIPIRPFEKYVVDFITVSQRW